MVAVAFLCSGGGGNLRLIHSLVERGALPGVSICGVITDRECGALGWARAHGIAARQVTYTRAQPGPLRDVLHQLVPDLVVTTIHKILDDELLAAYEGRTVNLHYSLLPAFGGSIGMEPVRQALGKGCRVIGATAHRVTSELDGGPILAQACIATRPAMPDSALHDAVFRCGAVALLAAIDGLLAPSLQQPGTLLHAGQVEILANPCPRPAVCEAIQRQDFWEALR